MKHPDFHRSRPLSSAIALAGYLAGAVAVPWSVNASAAPVQPVLASPEQARAEDTVLRLLADPAVKAAAQQAATSLAATPRGLTPAGAARIQAAVAEWTASLAFHVVAHHQPRATILWVTDDTPRTWLGHTLPGVGTSGDNPDNVYREAVLDGAGTYEIVGKVDPAHRPAQFSFEFDRGADILPTAPINAGSAGTGNTTAMITDRDLTIAPDGSFRITVNGAGEGRGHVALGSGPYTVGLRDTLSDWNQRPNHISVRRLDATPDTAIDYDALRQEVAGTLGRYVAYWSRFPDKFFGGIPANTASAAIPREGGWGYVAGVHFKLAPGEALVVRTTDGGARYTGFQITDTWMIAENAKRYQTSLNKSQVRPDPDGGYTYVIAASDPGVANWLDTAGMAEGYGVLRWQAAPPGTDKALLVRDAKVVHLADLATIPGLPRVTPAERSAALLARADGYANRTR